MRIALSKHGQAVFLHAGSGSRRWTADAASIRSASIAGDANFDVRASLKDRAAASREAGLSINRNAIWRDRGVVVNRRMRNRMFKYEKRDSL
ncbi:MAG: hypothetical protein ACRYF7_03495 [Janthinobacterium lividum]